MKTMEESMSFLGCIAMVWNCYASDEIDSSLSPLIRKSLFIEGTSSGEMSLMRRVGDINVDGFDDWALSWQAVNILRQEESDIFYMTDHISGDNGGFVGVSFPVIPHQDIDTSSKTFNLKAKTTIIDWS